MRQNRYSRSQNLLFGTSEFVYVLWFFQDFELDGDVPVAALVGEGVLDGVVQLDLVEIPVETHGDVVFHNTFVNLYNNFCILLRKRVFN